MTKVYPGTNVLIRPQDAHIKDPFWRIERAGIRRKIATAALQGMLSSPAVADRSAVDKAAWAQQACGFADALLDKLEEGAP